MPISDSEFTKDMRDVVLYRLFADVKLETDFLVALILGKQRKDSQLLSAKPSQLCPSVVAPV